MMRERCRAGFYVVGQTVELRAIDVPPPGPGEVRLRVTRSGVCGSDLHVWSGRWQNREMSPGHEFAGTVVGVGPGVEGVAPGLRACVEPLLYCGRCRFCTTGHDNLCVESRFVSLDMHGGFAEEINVPAYTLYPLGDGVTDEQGALVEPLAVGLHGVRLAQVACGEDVVILGAGTIGLMALQAARAAGAGRVFIAAKYEHQHRAAQDLGATGVLSADPAERNRELGELVPLGADVVLDTVGSGAPGLAGPLDAVRKGGRVLLYGGYHQPTTADLGPVVFKEVTLIGSNCYGVFGRRRDFELALDLIRAGRVRVERLVTHRFPFEQIAEAFRVSADKSQGVIKAHLVFE